MYKLNLAPDHETIEHTLKKKITWSHYDGKALSYNPGLQLPHLHGPAHTPDNNRWDTPPI